MAQALLPALPRRHVRGRGLVWITLIGVMVVACSSSTDERSAHDDMAEGALDGAITADGFGGDLGVEAATDAGGEGAQADVVAPDALVGFLSFGPQMVDDEGPCEGLTCVVSFDDGPSQTLEVMYSESLEGGAPAPVEGVAIRFQPVGVPEGVSASLQDTVVYTDADGVALTVLTLYPVVGASFEVEVMKPGMPHVDPLSFQVVAPPCDGCGSLIVDVTSDSVDDPKDSTIEGLLYYQVVTGSPSCNEMGPPDLPPADLATTPIPWGELIVFEQLPGLQDEGNQHYTLVIVVRDEDGEPIGWGCDDQVSIVWGGVSYQYIIYQEWSD